MQTKLWLCCNLLIWVYWGYSKIDRNNTADLILQHLLMKDIMESIDCYVVTDQKQFNEYIEYLISMTEGLNLRGSFSTMSTAINSIEKIGMHTIVIMDIDAADRKVSSMDLYNSVSGFAKVIFTTVRLKKEVENYIKIGDDLIVAPFSYESFLKSIRKLFPNQFVDYQE